MIASRLLLFVEAPVVVPVAATSKGAQFEHSLGARKVPSSAGDAEAILDEMPARSFDHARGDGKTAADELVVTHVRGVVGEVAGALLDRLSVVGRQASEGCRLTDPGDHVANGAGQQLG